MNFKTGIKKRLEICLLISISFVISCCPNASDPGMENVKRGLNFSSSYFGSVKYTIYLPSSYDENPTERYPVIFLLHGGGGNHESYVCSIKLTATIQTLIERGTFGSAIIIMPDGDLGWWVDNKAGTKRYHSFLVEEFFPYIDANYRTISEREHRAIGGLSMGGFGSFSLTFRDVDLFKVVATSAAAIPTSVEGAATFPFMKPTFGDPFDPDYYRIHDPLTLAETASRLNELAIYLDVGDSDLISRPGCERLHDILADRGIEHAFGIYPGGHDNNYFNSRIDEFLEFIWQHIQP